MGETIRESKSRSNSSLPKPSVAEKIEKPPPRPPTPTRLGPDPQEEERQLAIIFLQKLLRGRAIQNMMFEGKERRAELIRELKASDSFEDVDDQPKSPTKSVPKDTQKEYEQKLLDSIIDDMLGTIVGRGMDFLSKELVRIHQERKLAHMVQEAEKLR